MDGIAPTTARTRLALSAARLARWASRATGRGAGGMIGGLVAHAIDPNILARLGAGKKVILVTGTNGKSTTTRMLAAAVRTSYAVCTNDGGDNMDAGIISALVANPRATHLVLEVDELHVPHIADALNPEGLVLLNLSRDQLDRCGELGTIEKALRGAVDKHPDMTVIANCDDVSMTSAAWDSPHPVWVAAGTGWTADSGSCPRTGGHITHTMDGWRADNPMPDGTTFCRPDPAYSYTDQALIIHHTGDVAAHDKPKHASDTSVDVSLTIPGRANRANAACAIAAAHAVFGIDIDAAAAAVGQVHDVAGRYALYDRDDHQVHMLLAKNPAGWQEALSMVDRSAAGLVIAVNGQVADGEDLSWLWDVRFEDFGKLPVVAAGQRGTDLAVRLTYADVDYTLTHDPLAAIDSCPPGRVELLANYTAFRDIKKALAAQSPNAESSGHSPRSRISRILDGVTAAARPVASAGWEGFKHVRSAARRARLPRDHRHMQATPSTTKKGA